MSTTGLPTPYNGGPTRSKRQHERWKLRGQAQRCTTYFPIFQRFLHQLWFSSEICFTQRHWTQWSLRFLGYVESPYDLKAGSNCLFYERRMKDPSAKKNCKENVKQKRKHCRAKTRSGAKNTNENELQSYVQRRVLSKRKSTEIITPIPGESAQNRNKNW